MESYYQWPGKVGDWPSTVGRDKSYFDIRFVWLDMRGGLTIAADSYWGNQVRVITRSHIMQGGEFSTKVVDRPVRVDSGAQVYSFALLYNCHIGHHAVVACGSVVRNMTVPPWVVVEGNPAVITRCWNGRKWLPFRKEFMRLKNDSSGWELLNSVWGSPEAALDNLETGWLEEWERERRERASE